MDNSPKPIIRLDLIFDSRRLIIWFRFKPDGDPFVISYQGPLMRYDELFRMVRTSYLPSIP